MAFTHAMKHFSNSGALMYRAIWISDVHLGSPSCRAECLLDFLRHHDSEYLYLVGDIVDGWQLKKNWYWKQSYNNVVQKILRRARKGAKVTYIPGNHDEFARNYVGLLFGDIRVCRQAEHTTISGRRLLVMHGDEFDSVVQCARWLAVLGSRAHDFTVEVNRLLNAVRKRLGFPYWSLSQYLKQKVKTAMMHMADFEQAVADEARRRGADGVVCGHIHRPVIRDLGGVTYFNAGDWVESCTALVEHLDGRMDLIEWQHERPDGQRAKRAVYSAAGSTMNGKFALAEFPCGSVT